MPKPTGKKSKLPPDYDVILPGMGYTKPTKKSPPKKIKSRSATKPAPLPQVSRPGSSKNNMVRFKTKKGK